MAADRHASGLPALLTFHKLTDGCTYGSTNRSPVRFRLLLRALRDSGYSFIPLEDATQSGGEGIAITFDDGYRHLASNLPPLIEEFGLAPTIFVPTGYLGMDNSWDYSHIFYSDPHLNRGDIRLLASLGVRFGSHGHTHISLTRCSCRQLGDDLERSRGLLEDILGQPITCISYPLGRVDQRIMEAAWEAGYTDGFTMRFPAESDTPLNRGRYGVWSIDTLSSIRRKLGGGWPRRMEAVKARAISGLSGGTGLWNRLRGKTYADTER